MTRRILVFFTLCLGLAFSQPSIWSVVSNTLQSAVTANANGTALAVGGLSSASMTVNCSVACSGGTTINFEGSEDGTNYVAINAIQYGTNTVASTVLNQGTTITVWKMSVGSLSNIRARISGYSSGTITVTGRATAAPYVPDVLNSNSVAATPAGTNVIGHVIADTTSTTAVTQATAANLNAAVVGVGTAGSASGGVLTVQGAASMTKILVTPDSVALPANQSANVAQINGVTPLMGNGTTGTGSPRVTIASDNTAFSVNSTLGTETTKVIGTVRAQGNLGAAFDSAMGAAPPANGVFMGGIASGATGGFLSGVPICDTFYNINIVTATTTLAVTGVSGRHVRICAMDLVAAGADNVGIISGTGATCGTGSAAIVGTSAATGYNFAANGGIAKGNGIGTVMRTVATGDSVCIITSAAVQLSGVISYTIY